MWATAMVWVCWRADALRVLTDHELELKAVPKHCPFMKLHVLQQWVYHDMGNHDMENPHVLMHAGIVWCA